MFCVLTSLQNGERRRSSQLQVSLVRPAFKKPVPGWLVGSRGAAACLQRAGPRWRDIDWRTGAGGGLRLMALGEINVPVNSKRQGAVHAGRLQLLASLLLHRQ